MTECVTIGDATLYCGDCREVLPMLGSVDVVITDPPYSDFTKMNARTHKNKSFLNKSEAAYVPFAMALDDITALFVSIAPNLGRWLIASMDFRHVAALERDCPKGLRFIRVGIWVKNNSAPQFTGDRPAQAFEAIAIMHAEGQRLRWNGGGARGVWITDVERNNGHPTPKPLELIMNWVGLFSDAGELVFDPFMGSGTTGVACAKMGRKFIGVEICEQYFDIACRRIEDAYRQGVLFAPGVPVMKQVPLNL